MKNNININLLPWREARIKQKNLLFIVSYILSILLALTILGIIYFVMYFNNKKIMTGNLYLQSEIQKLNTPIEEIGILKTKIADLQIKIEPMTRLFVDKILFPKLLETIASAIPEEVYLQKITLQNTTVEMLGLAQTDTQANDFIRNLSNFKFIANPTILQINAENNQPDTGVRRFTISFEFKPIIESI